MGLNEIFKKQGGFTLIKRYIQSGAIFTATFEFLLLGKSRTALEILRLSTQLKSFKKIKRTYAKRLSDFEGKYDNSIIKSHGKKIWVCWLQGIENAPELVKHCYQSLCNNIEGYSITLITNDNYKEYISFPDYIQQKIDSGIIKGAHMTDLLRLELLLKYGGTWIDATVFCSSSQIPEYMLESDLFMFQCLKPGRDGHTNIASNWFISACSNNKILFMTKEILYDYWKYHNSIMDYFIFHEVFRLVVDKYKQEWSDVIPVCNSTPHILLLRLFDEYDEKVYEAITSQTPFHKLSYKFEPAKAEKTGTYYKKIIGNR